MRAHKQMRGSMVNQLLIKAFCLSSVPWLWVCMGSIWWIVLGTCVRTPLPGTRWDGPAGMRVRTRRGHTVLGEMVQGPRGVLQVHAQVTAAAAQLPPWRITRWRKLLTLMKLITLKALTSILALRNITRTCTRVCAYVCMCEAWRCIIHTYTEIYHTHTRAHWDRVRLKCTVP